MTATVAKQRWLDKAATINKAIRVYAARYSNTSTGENAWNTRINFIRDNFFDSRPATVLAQFQADGLWPTLAAPDFSQHGGSVPNNYSLAMTGPGGAQIYYTMNGTDPRDPAAVLYSGPVTLSSPVTVSARSLLSGTWSPLTQAFFSVSTEPASAANLVISEINYNPENPFLPAELAVSPDKDEYEYIEVMNIRPSSSVDLTGVRFTAGITTVALGNQILAPGERAVFVKNLAAFNVRYAAVVPAPRILGTYSGSLNNQGEQIVLNAAGGAVIRDFVYDDDPPWPAVADGGGTTLTLIAPLTNPDHSLPQNWRDSAATGGTPGGTDAMGYSSWKSTYGVVLDTDDTDKDGLNAVMEYALGTLPGTANPGRVTTGMTPDGFLTISLAHGATADDVRLTPEVSTDLNTWSSTGVTVIAIVRNPDGTNTTTWKAPLQAPADSRAFLHIKAELR
jgi:hypothetical protein